MLKNIAALVFAVGAAFGQTLSFEVASVKPAGGMDPAAIMSGKMRIGMKVDAARVDIGMLSPADLIRIAYKVKSCQVQGPDWITSERFNIMAKLPEGGKEDQVPEMLQTLLAERFKLTFHRQSKEQNVYALVVAKGGHKLKPADPVPEASTPEPGASGVRMSGDIQGKGMVVSGGPNGNQTKVTMNGGMMHMENSKMPITGFVDMLARFVDKPVVDQTELKGDYQIAIDLSMEDMKNIARASGMGAMMGGGGGDASRPAESASDPTSSVFTSVQQLGLKLEARKSAIDLEKVPTEN
ncbi:MAG: hypothetical protein JWP63_5980 [Candidatus Solibacter sp.]|nr:hypothetical protein [Candidatus Solibacter sp.]